MAAMRAMCRCPFSHEIKRKATAGVVWTTGGVVVMSTLCKSPTGDSKVKFEAHMVTCNALQDAYASIHRLASGLGLGTWTGEKSPQYLGALVIDRDQGQWPMVQEQVRACRWARAGWVFACVRAHS